MNCFKLSGYLARTSTFGETKNGKEYVTATLRVERNAESDTEDTPKVSGWRNDVVQQFRKVGRERPLTVTGVIRTRRWTLPNKDEAVVITDLIATEVSFEPRNKDYPDWG